MERVRSFCSCQVAQPAAAFGERQELCPGRTRPPPRQPAMANTRQYNNVYDAMLAGFMKLCLVLGIAALTLSKFTGFEWCAPSLQQRDGAPLGAARADRRCSRRDTGRAAAV